MTGRQGPSERRSRPRLVSEMGPAAVAVGRIAPTGRTAPKAPAGQSCSDDVFPANTDDWSFPLTTDDCDSRRRMIVTKDKFFSPSHQTRPYTKKGL